jgi:SPP1 gp7 family putative phage head morphogenesis protein
MAQSQLLTEIATRHQVYLERLKSGEANQFAAFLLEIDRSIRARLSGEDLTEFTRARMERLLAALERDLKKIMDRHYTQLSGNLIDLAQYEAAFESRSLGQIVVGFEPVIPSETQVIAAVTSRPLSVRGPDGGKLLESFIRDWQSTDIKRVSGAIRQGFFEGKTTSQILQVVRGTRANKYRDGVVAIVNRDADAIVKTAVQHAATQARQMTWERNADSVLGVRWVSTLDGRTTIQCRSLDGRVFPVNAGPRPPLHIRCRSTTVADIDPAFKFLRQGATRSSINGQVDANQTYYDWLKTQPAAFQDSAIGTTRATLLRRGGLSAERFAELNIGRNFEPLTLDEMRRLEPIAFERAGI